MMIPRSKGQKSDASLLAGRFLILDLAKNMSKSSHFSKKMSELRMFLRIVEVRSTEQSGIKGVKIPFDLNIL